MCADARQAVVFTSHQLSYNFPEHLSNVLQTRSDDRDRFLLRKLSYLFLILSSWWLRCFTNVYINGPDVLRTTDLMQ